MKSIASSFSLLVQALWLPIWLEFLWGELPSESQFALNPVPDPIPADRPESDPDVQCILRYQKGDTDAFETLFHKWKHPLISFCYRSIGDIAEAEGLALEVFIKIHQSAHRYRPTARFSTYLFSIARRLLLNHHRQRRRKPLELIDPGDLQFQCHPEHQDTHHIHDMEEQFQHALLTLPELQRTALLLVTQQGMHPHEVATILGKAPSATRVMIHRARETLKSQLEATL